MKQIKLICCLIAMVYIKTASSQKVYTYYLDRYLNITDKKDAAAVYKGKGQRQDSIFVVDCYNKETDHLEITASFADSLLTNLHGKFESYYANGNSQSQGTYSNGEKSGIWQNWDDQGNKTDSIIYANNTRVAYATYNFIKREKKPDWLSWYQFTDSLKNTFYQQTFFDSGKIETEANFVGNLGLLKTYTKGQITIDTVYTREQAEATFPGGNMEWARYVQKSVSDFNPADYGAGNGEYMAIIRFMIDEDGNITNVKPETNFGHHMETKAMDIIKKGPRWVPASRFGKRIKAYRRQPLTFFVSGL